MSKNRGSVSGKISLYHSVVQYVSPILQDWQRFLIDGLHFSRNGSEYFGAQLWPVIDNLTKDLPTKLPIWSEINNNNPQALLSR